MAGRAFGPRRRWCLGEAWRGLHSAWRSTRTRCADWEGGKERRVRVGDPRIDSGQGWARGFQLAVGDRVVAAQLGVSGANRGPARKDRKGIAQRQGAEGWVWSALRRSVGLASVVGNDRWGPCKDRRASTSILACPGDATQTEQRSQSIDSSTYASINQCRTSQTNKKDRARVPRDKPTNPQSELARSRSRERGRQERPRPSASKPPATHTLCRRECSVNDPATI